MCHVGELGLVATSAPVGFRRFLLLGCPSVERKSFFDQARRMTPPLQASQVVKAPMDVWRWLTSYGERNALSH